MTNGTNNLPAVDDRELITRAARSDTAAVARVLSELERESGRSLPLVAEFWRLTPLPARFVGITGAAGAGKSSLIARLLTEYAANSARPAVLAIDPSSRASGGSFLGDRVRMTESAPGAFVRSLPNRAIAGGLAPATAIAIALLSRCGFDPIIVETVGVGQSEVAVSHIVHTTVTCVAPGLGDRIQAAKAGLMETADMFVITKSDLPAARTALDHVKSMANAGQRAPGTWRRPVCAISARTGEGIPELMAELSAHHDWACRARLIQSKSQALAAECVRWAIDVRARQAARNHAADDPLRNVAADVAAGRTDPVTASRLWIPS